MRGGRWRMHHRISSSELLVSVTVVCPELPTTLAAEEKVAAPTQRAGQRGRRLGERTRERRRTPHDYRRQPTHVAAAGVGVLVEVVHRNRVGRGAACCVDGQWQWHEEREHPASDKVACARVQRSLREHAQEHARLGPNPLLLPKHEVGAGGPALEQPFQQRRGHEVGAQVRAHRRQTRQRRVEAVQLEPRQQLR